MKKALISLAISGALLLVSLGLCGLGLRSGGDVSAGPDLARVGLAGFALSAIGILVSLTWLLIAAITDKGGSSRSSGEQPPYPPPQFSSAPIYPPAPPASTHSRGEPPESGS